MNYNPNRKPPGSAGGTGGQFDYGATNGAVSAGVNLHTDEALTWQSFIDYRDIPPEDDFTEDVLPHGNHAHRTIATGIDVVTNANGDKYLALSEERNSHIPSHFRMDDGHYRGDAPIVYMTYPEALSADPLGRRVDSPAQAFAYGNSWCLDNYPDQWEFIAGRTVEPGMSRTRDKELFIAQTQDKFHELYRRRDSTIMYRRPDDGRVVLARPADPSRASQSLNSTHVYDEDGLDVITGTVPTIGVPTPSHSPVPLNVQSYRGMFPLENFDKLYGEHVRRAKELGYLTPDGKKLRPKTPPQVKDLFARMNDFAKVFDIVDKDWQRR